jgi:hypothetical protein
VTHHRRSSRRRVAHAFTATAVIAGAFAFAPTASAMPVPGSVELRIESISSTPTGRGMTTGQVTLVIKNDSLTTATNATVTIGLPADFLADLAASSSGCSASTASIQCNVGAIASGASATVWVGLTARLGTALGTQSLTVTSLTSDQPNSVGKVTTRVWNHESDGQGGSLETCWPLANPSPNMDIGGGGTGFSPACNGDPDAAELTPDVISTAGGFPGPVAQSVTRSWEHRFVIKPATTDTYRFCASSIDDGGYLAIAPIGVGDSAHDIAFSTPSFGNVVSNPLSLTANAQYSVIFRVSNRGAIGVDNGGSGLGGYGALGIAPSSESCNPSTAQITLDEMIQGATQYPISIDVVPAANLRIEGGAFGRSGAGLRSTIRTLNDVGDPTAFSVEATGAIAGAGQDCTPQGSAFHCVGPTVKSGDRHVFTVDLATGAPSVNWKIDSSITDGVSSDDTLVFFSH